jgi:hypothetical protein
MIEVLGNRFELEPEFFANYLEGTELYRMGMVEPLSLRAPARAPSLLPDYIKKSPFYAVEYRRPYRIEGGRERVVGLRVAETSTPRGIKPVHETLCDYFVSEKVSVYKKKGSSTGKPGLTGYNYMRKANMLRTLQLSFSLINSCRTSCPPPTS